MKTIGIIITLVVAFIVSVFGIVAYLTTGMYGAADRFFEAVENKDYNAAYALLSEDFQAETSKEELQRYLKGNSMSTVKDADWNSWSRSWNSGVVSGLLSTKSGTNIPARLTFVKVDGKWKLNSIVELEGTSGDSSSVAVLPSESEQVKLVRDSMSVFAKSMKEKDMTDFHSHIAVLWRQQDSVKDLEDGFSDFMNKEINLLVLQDFSPEFTRESTVDEDGNLVIAGVYPTKPSEVHFEHTYIREGLSWKMAKIWISVEPRSPQASRLKLAGR